MHKLRTDRERVKDRITRVRRHYRLESSGRCRDRENCASEGGASSWLAPRCWSDCADRVLEMRPTWSRNDLPFKERFVNDVTVPIGQGRSLVLKQSLVPDMPVWDASIVLARYIVRHPASVANKRVIELGAGCGLAGLAAVVAGAHVTLTDQAPLLPLLEENVRKNLSAEERARADVRLLDWGSEVTSFRPPVDVIIAADCIYALQAFDELSKTLVELSNAGTEILMAYEERWRDVERWFQDSLEAHGMQSAVLPPAELDPEYTHPKIKILTLRTTDAVARSHPPKDS